MLRRKAYGRLLEWKRREHGPLLVEGARRVGKTHLLKRFGRSEYEHVMYADLAGDPEMRSAFDGEPDADSILNALEMRPDGGGFAPGSTLVILDGVQGCPSARVAMGMLSADMGCDVAASLTLPGPPAAGGGGRPALAGREERMTLRSLDFEEFLWAVGVPERNICDIRHSVRAGTEISKPMLQAFEQKFRDYTIVGGMPEAVAAFAETGDYMKARDAQTIAAGAWMDDARRLRPVADAAKALACLESMPEQLSCANRKFTYSRVDGGRRGASARMYRESLRWIERAGFGSFCYALSQPRPPLAARAREGMFKVYLPDTGLLMSMYGKDAMAAAFKGNDPHKMGAVAENSVAEALTKAGCPLYYYRKTGGEGMMDVDFVIELGGEAAAVEVDTGRPRIGPPLPRAENAFGIRRRIMFGRTNIYTDEDGVEHYPLFAAAFADELRPPKPATEPDGIDWEAVSASPMRAGGSAERRR